MKVAVLSPVAWRTPPRNYGPWEQMAYNISEGIRELGADVTLFATGDSFTSGKLESICPKGYEEDREVDAKVAECLHIANLMENAHKFDIIHNNYDFLPLTFSRLISKPMVTTIHGFSSPKIIPVYEKYNDVNHYVSISNADRSPKLHYNATVYNGIDPKSFTFQNESDEYLLFFGRIHHDKGVWEAIQIALKSRRKLQIAGIIQDQNYFREKVEPYIDNQQVVYLGPAGPQKRDKLMGNAYALLHPINFDEPFGLSVAESMFCGTPVIAFNRGSMPELIEHEKTGFLVNDIYQAAEAVSDIKKIKRKDCRERALAMFSLDRMAKDYYAVYREILEQ
jgi:glycosyltransferase involved in cell wall biosynthesis